MFQVTKEAGLTFNSKKCKMGVFEIEFLGDPISQEGIKPNSALINFMGQTRTSSDKLGIQLLLSDVNYFSKCLSFWQKQVPSTTQNFRVDV